MKNRTIGKIKAFEIARNIVGLLISIGFTNKEDLNFIVEQMPVIIEKSHIADET
jgi:hypothetical protein